MPPHRLPTFVPGGVALRATLIFPFRASERCVYSASMFERSKFKVGQKSIVVPGLKTALRYL